MIRRRSLWLTVLAMSGCAGPALEPGFGSVDPQERTAAIIDAAKTNDKAAIPHLIAMLDSIDPAERMLASSALRRLTGLDLGYRFYDPPWRRREAALTWRRWLQSRSNESSITTQFPNSISVSTSSKSP